MNVGLREVRQLSELAEAVLKRGAGEEGLADYNRDRIGEWRGLLGLDGELRGGEGWLGEVMPRLLPCIPATGETLATLVGRLGLEWTAAPKG